MPSAPCRNTAVRHQARNKPEDLPRGARKAAVSDIPITDLSEAREPAKKNWRDFSSQQWASFLRNREEQLFLVLTLLIGALVGMVVVAFIPLTERSGARLYPAGGAAWRRLLAQRSWGICYIAFFPMPGEAEFRKRKLPLDAQAGRISLGTVFGKFFCTFATLASGIPLGREGPAVQVGAGIASVLGRSLGLRFEFPHGQGHDDQSGACRCAEGRIGIRSAHGAGAGGWPGTVFRQTTGQDDVSGRAVAGWERAFGARSAVSGACGAGVRAEGVGCSESECERSSGGGGRGRVGAEVAAASRGPGEFAGIVHSCEGGCAADALRGRAVLR